MKPSIRALNDTLKAASVKSRQCEQQIEDSGLGQSFRDLEKTGREKKWVISVIV